MNIMGQQHIDLYDPRLEHDACGIGAVVNINGVPTRAAVHDALSIVENLEHRAGRDAEGTTGDGVGILLQVSHPFFIRHAPQAGIQLGGPRDYGIGMLFMPQDEQKREAAKRALMRAIEGEGMDFLGWREVPVNPGILGERALARMPYILQCFAGRPDGTAKGLGFDRKLYVARRVFEKACGDAYVCSLSSRTIVYKGMFLVHQLRDFYKDLQDDEMVSAMALVHSRFSTNTDPSWERAHPNRLLLHNGEINTIRGNADRMMAREWTMQSPIFGNDTDKVYPVINGEGSDSAMLDNTLEFLAMNGMDLPLAALAAIPEAWQNDKRLSGGVRSLFRYYSTIMEPWDGPAAIFFSDGDIVGAMLDRNGLRPSRWCRTDDGRLILSSETGALDIPPEKIIKKERLHPGKLLIIDTVRAEVIEDTPLKEYYASRQPYGEWLDRYLTPIASLPDPGRELPEYDQDTRDRLYKAFGYTYEEVKSVILPMAKTGIEPTVSMGTDIPLAVLSQTHPPLFNYFKQLFAQVTNPPIDAIREEIVTDTTVYIGSSGDILTEKAENCRLLQLSGPILAEEDFLKICSLDRPGLKSETLSLLYLKGQCLENVLDTLAQKCDDAYSRGANIMILTDRNIDCQYRAIPSLLAVSALQHHLIRNKRSTAVSLILESAEPRDVHHFAVLLGYGAQAIFPYLALECISEITKREMLAKNRHTAQADYRSAILHGVVKVASKMGISTMQSYQGAQIFEALGIRGDVIDKYFTNTISRIGGIGLDEIGQDVDFCHARAFDPLGLDIDMTLDSTGIHKLRSGSSAEDHLYSPMTIVALQEAVRSRDYGRFKEYTAMLDGKTKPHTLRDMMEFTFDGSEGIPIEQVEPVSEIVKRFKTGAMSYGSLSQEAHECLAAAMNRLGGRSNSGEGGEQPERLKDERCSMIKQVASGRFGVTSEYLMSAREIQIKMAQGAKPGEGGQLPAEKVYPWIAKTRHSTPGVQLISPPPHHDIYSIEDLAQLIFDLKNANRSARISVKLVSETGVGTIASGVAKAGAQVILISGYDGGTGASPRTSIHNAGLPWELGLAETHQALVRNGLRPMVVVETDGKLMTGRDVAIAAMLGAEEYGFATAPLVSIGCVMMRVCNLDTCPMGIATQNPLLRKRFCGKPEHVINFMEFIAQELREIMAAAGIRTVSELIGRVDLLRPRALAGQKRGGMVEMAGILARMNVPEKSGISFRADKAYDFHLNDTIDERVLLKNLGNAMEQGKKAEISLKVGSTNRATGTLFGSRITAVHGSLLPEDTITAHCKGSGGQSFGAFIPNGLTLELEGDANDYFGKGLSGGKLIVFPPKESRFRAEDNIIIGNVALYGATSGMAYINGIAGERFCVRNSGACAVAEGTGDHGCEYMTGGRVVILGKTGRNFAAGMSGGIAYVLDEDGSFRENINLDMVRIVDIDESDAEELRQMIAEHVRATGSAKGKQILEQFTANLRLFTKILPLDYGKVMAEIKRLRKAGISAGQAEIDAFTAIMKERK
jgi:glutamate synthase (NADPH) large chain